MINIVWKNILVDETLFIYRLNLLTVFIFHEISINRIKFNIYTYKLKWSPLLLNVLGIKYSKLS